MFHPYTPWGFRSETMDVFWGCRSETLVENGLMVGELASTQGHKINGG